MKKKLNKLIPLILSFMLFVPIGTISHEYGHVLVAEYLGYNTVLHYNSMNLVNNNQIDENVKIEKNNFHSFLITIGGPIQTILTGTFGFILVLNRRKRNLFSKLNFLEWLYIFLALFWLRQIFNLVFSFISEIIAPNGSYFGGDEPWISEYLGLNRGTIPIFFCITGIIVFVYICIKIIPKNIRIPFIISCPIGGLLGYFLWMNVLGPQLMP
jgi:hypothetical protein